MVRPRIRLFISRTGARDKKDRAFIPSSNRRQPHERNLSDESTEGSVRGARTSTADRCDRVVSPIVNGYSHTILQRAETERTLAASKPKRTRRLRWPRPLSRYEIVRPRRPACAARVRIELSRKNDGNRGTAEWRVGDVDRATEPVDELLDERETDPTSR